jgi:hypothetical protein
MLDSPRTTPYLRPYHPSTKAHPAKAGAAKPRVLAALRDAARYSPPDATKDPHDRRAAEGEHCVRILQRMPS